MIDESGYKTSQLIRILGAVLMTLITSGIITISVIAVVKHFALT